MDTVEIKVPCQRNVCRDAKNGRYYVAGRSGDVSRRNQKSMQKLQHVGQKEKERDLKKISRAS